MPVRFVVQSAQSVRWLFSTPFRSGNVQLGSRRFGFRFLLPARAFEVAPVL